MNRKSPVVYLIIVVLVSAAALFFRAGPAVPKTPGLSNDSTGLIVGSNAIYVADQAPTQSISVAVVHLEKPGFVVVREDVSGAPGKILGVSGILPLGETNNRASVSLSSVTRDGETFYAVLYIDDGDGIFNPAKDKPALDSVSAEPVMMIFNVSADASESGTVSL